MWVCPKCKAHNHDSLKWCWWCRTESDGTEHPRLLSKLNRPLVPVGVPRQFSIGTLMILIALFGVLFGFLKTYNVTPVGFVVIALFFLIIAAAQAVLFKGKRPREASVVAGAVFGFVLSQIFCSLYPTDYLTVIISWTVAGGCCGYLAGCLVAGVFLVREREKSDEDQPVVMAELVGDDQHPAPADSQTAASERPPKNAVDQIIEASKVPNAGGGERFQAGREQGPPAPGGTLLSCLDSPVIGVSIASLLIGLLLLRYFAGLVVITVFFVALLILRARRLAEQTSDKRNADMHPPNRWFIIGGAFYGLTISAALVITGNMGLVAMVVCTVLGGAGGYYAGRHWDGIYQIVMAIFNARADASAGAPGTRASSSHPSPLPMAEGTDFKLPKAVGVTRRFSVGTLMILTAMFGVLFAVLTILDANPIVFIMVAVFFAGTALAQMVLFGGQEPRKASVVGGFFLGLIIGLAGVVIAEKAKFTGAFGSRSGLEYTNTVSCAFIAMIFGGPLGYVAGCLSASIFLVRERETAQEENDEGEMTKDEGMTNGEGQMPKE